MIRFLLLITLIVHLGYTGDSDTRVLRLAHSLDPSHSAHKAMVFMDEELSRISHGELTIDIYPSSQLGSEREMIELLQLGAIDMTKTASSVLENFSPKVKVLSMPYLFFNDAHEEKVLKGPIGEELLQSGTDYFIRRLTYYDAGSRSFYTIDRKVEKPSDLRGLKIRVMNSQTAIALMNAFGAAATPISFGELYTALQQGVVDGAENNPPSFFLTRHYEVCEYYTLNEHTQIPDILMISEHTWQSLSDQEKQWVKKAADASAEYQKEVWADSEREALQAVKDAGVQVIIPDRGLFSQHVEGLAERLLESEKEALHLYQKIKELEKAERNN